MSLYEKCAIKIIFSIDNNYYLIQDKELKQLLKRIKVKYKKYLNHNDVMFLNIDKIRMAFIQEFSYNNINKEVKGLNNIIDTFNEILYYNNDNEFFKQVESDYILLNSYLNKD